MQRAASSPPEVPPKWLMPASPAVPVASVPATATSRAARFTRDLRPEAIIAAEYAVELGAMDDFRQRACRVHAMHVDVRGGIVEPARRRHDRRDAER